jgi:spore germination cell wall hydrolase CwlJ-like protein
MPLQREEKAMLKALVRPHAAVVALLSCVAVLTHPGDAAASWKSERHCLATAIYFEARGESTKGQKAVADVVLARTHVRGRPKTVCGVVYQGSKRRTGCQFSFTCDGKSDVARNKKSGKKALRIASAALRAHERGKRKSVVRGATFYHAKYVKPRWAKRMVKVAVIGAHVFYRPKRGRLS